MAVLLYPDKIEALFAREILERDGFIIVDIPTEEPYEDINGPIVGFYARKPHSLPSKPPSLPRMFLDAFRGEDGEEIDPQLKVLGMSPAEPLRIRASIDIDSHLVIIRARKENLRKIMQKLESTKITEIKYVPEDVFAT